MNILFITDNFFPESNAPAIRTRAHCKEWVRQGHRVTVVTCAPNFPEGKIFQGYRNSIWHTEHISGIKVIRVISYISQNKGVIRRTLDYLSFGISSMFGGLCVRDVDVVVGTSPQIFAAMSSMLVAKIKRVPWIFELRDLWPESIEAVGLDNLPFLRLLQSLVNKLYFSADGIVCVTDSFKYYLRELGICSDKIKVITNGVDLKQFQPDISATSIERAVPKDNLTWGYIGTVGMAHGLETLIKAAKILEERNYSSIYSGKIIGEGAEKKTLERMAKRLGCKTIEFFGAFEHQQATRYWGLIDVLVIHLRDHHEFQKVIPSKLFEAMALGIPVIHCVKGESSAIVSRHDVGLLVMPEDPEALASAIHEILSDRAKYQRFSTNAMAAARQYDRCKLASEMVDFMHATINAA